MNGRFAPAIDSDRLRELLSGINSFGVDSSGGYSRPGFSDADMAARHWLKDRMTSEGLATWLDAVGNLFGRLGPQDGPCIMTGSHLDTVPQGGAYDGALGVAVALECVLAMRYAGIEPAIPIEVVATSEEEGRFGGMLGSQAIAGLVTSEWIANASDADGVRLPDAMRAQGLDPLRAETARREPGMVAAFVELHVEQGPVLEAASVPIGIADSVSGIIHWGVTLSGAANHSGTTPMEMRADAFAGLAGIAAAIPDIVSEVGTDQSRITIGKVELKPNFPHTVPGEAAFSVIIRDTDEAVMRRLARAIDDAIEQGAKRNRLRYELVERSRIAPVALDVRLADLLAAEAENLGLGHLRMASGAGHDAQTMQALCPSALIFVPSRGGISHAPEEWTDWEAILAGARLMLASLTRLSASDP